MTTCRIAVFRALQLGDLLCAVPALRAAFPHAEITLIGLPWARAFVRRFRHLLDAFLEFPGFPGLSELVPDLQQLPLFFDIAQASRFTLSIQLHGNDRLTNPLVHALGSRDLAGFYRPGEYCPDPTRFVPYADDEPEVRRLLRVPERLGLSVQSADLEFPVDATDEAEFRSLPNTEPLEETPYVCIHAGAGSLSRLWPAERFARVADGLAARGFRIVLTGSAGERELVRLVATQMRHPSIDLAGWTSLGSLGVLVRGARLVVCSDPGISHVAAALRTPSVVICCGADAALWAPEDAARHRVLAHPVERPPRGFAEWPRGHPSAHGVRPEEVLAQADDLLRSAATSAS